MDIVLRCNSLVLMGNGPAAVGDRDDKNAAVALPAVCAEFEACRLSGRVACRDVLWLVPRDGSCNDNVDQVGETRMLAERRVRIALAVGGALIVCSWIAYGFEAYNRHQRQEALRARIEALEAKTANTKKLIDQRKQ